jgi:hypothetical protein
MDYGDTASDDFSDADDAVRADLVAENLFAELSGILRPRSVAIVGASNNPA